MNKKNEKKEKSLTRVRAPSGLIALKYNNNFCNKFFKKNKIAVTVDQTSQVNVSRDLVYNVPKTPESNLEFFQTIIDLLLQLRASQSDKNVIVQNNTVVRENILKQLKSEMLRVGHNLTKNQIKNLEVISSDNFDEDTLTDILKSFLEGSKKKLTDEEKAGRTVSLEAVLPKLSLKERILNYLNVSKEIKHEDKTFKTVSNRFIYKKLPDIEKTAETEKESEFETSEEKEKFYTKLVNHPTVKNLLVKKSEKLKIPYDVIETSIIKNSELILPIVKIQTELLGSEILKKTRSFAKKILVKNISNTTETEENLVNKVINRTNITELKENLARNYERYDYFTSKHQTEIRRIQTDVKKLQKLASLTYDKNYIVKSVSNIDLNTRNKIQKNIIKMVSGRQLVSKFENISENFFQNYIQKKSLRHTNFINKVFENQTNENIEKVVHDRTDLKYRTINLNEETINDVNRKNVLSQKINKKHYFRDNVNETSVLNTKEHVDRYHLKNVSLSSEIKKIRELANIKNENKISKSKISFVDNIKNILHKYTKLDESINKIENAGFDKKVFDLTNLKTNFIFNNLEEETLKNLHDKIFRVNTDILKNTYKYKNYEKKIDIFKKLIIPADKPELQKNKVIKNTRNINLIKAPLVFSTLSTIIDSKINKISSEPLTAKKSFEVIFRDDKPKVTGEISKNEFYENKPYMVYKQEKKPEDKKEVKVSEKEIAKQEKEKEPKVVIEKKKETVTPEVLDAKAIDKRIKEKALGKREVIKMIESYMKDINIENLSGIIIEKVENKILMDRKRNGIF